MLFVLAFLIPAALSACKPGYYTNSKGTCSPCATDCNSCTSSKTCSECKPGLKWDKVKLICRPCTSCIDCSTLGCNTCQDNFILNSKKSCEPCPSDCTLCKSNFCQSCASGLYLDQSKVCQDCGEGCDVCSSPISCTSCNSGLYLETNGNCTQCIDNCNSCSGPGACNQCKDDLVFDGAQCCPASCKGCLSDKTCTNCPDGKFLSQGACESCPGDCSSCKEGVCATCNDGFWLDGPICSKCIEGCSKCSNSNTCDVCSTGYQLLNGTCIVCPTSCGSCQVPGVCSTCPTGKYLIDGSCCGKFCTSCDKINSCLGCKVGYLYQDDKCNECPSTCSHCAYGLCVCKLSSDFSTKTCPQPTALKKETPIVSENSVSTAGMVVLGIVAVAAFGVRKVWIRDQRTFY